VEMPDGRLVSTLFKGSGRAVSRAANSLALYGERGTLHLSGEAIEHVRIEHYDAVANTWQELAIPAQVTAALPQVDNYVQRDWNQLCREFVADIRNEGNSGYPTFHEGWLHNEIIDIIRSGRGWSALPTGTG
jgi:hypothetical protein